MDFRNLFQFEPQTGVRANPNLLKSPARFPSGSTFLSPVKSPQQVTNSLKSPTSPSSRKPSNRHHHIRRSPQRPHAHGAHQRHETCAVCLNDQVDMTLLPCNHVFHGDCILQWVQRNFSCPMCRQQIKQFLPIEAHFEKGYIPDPKMAVREQETLAKFSLIWEQHYLNKGTKKSAPSSPGSLEDADSSLLSDKHPLKQQSKLSTTRLASPVKRPTVITIEPLPEPAQLSVKEILDSAGVVTNELASPTSLPAPVGRPVLSKIFEVSKKKPQSEFDASLLPEITLYTPPPANVRVPRVTESKALSIPRHLASLLPNPLPLRLVPNATSHPVDKSVISETHEIQVAPSKFSPYSLVGGAAAGLTTFMGTKALDVAASKLLGANPALCPGIRAIPTMACFFFTYQNIVNSFDPETFNTADRKAGLSFAAAFLAGSLVNAKTLPSLTLPLRMGIQFGTFVYVRELFSETPNGQRRNPTFFEKAFSAMCAGTFGQLAFDVSQPRKPPLFAHSGFNLPTPPQLASLVRFSALRSAPAVAITALTYDFAYTALCASGRQL